MIFVLPVVVALAISLALTPVVRAAATRRGYIAKPKADRWHSRPTSMMGGIAILLSAMIGWTAFQGSLPTEGWTVIGASAFLGVVGLVDDLIQIKPYQKLIGQVLGAAIMIFAGLVLPWTGSATLNLAITFFWLIGITNAINLLDNMDGLAGGVAAIAAAFLAVNLYMSGLPQAATMCAIMAAVLVGFLVYNSSPATIFMGDVGSMFVGFFLASSALISANGVRSRSFAVVIFVPLLVLLIPIFDTTLVTVARKLAGRAASQGGRDHTSHRLVALGLSERRAVWLLYALAVASGVLGVFVNRLADVAISVAIVTTFSIGLALLGVYLVGVRVYDESEIKSAREHPLIALIFNLSHKRRLFEVSLDLILILLAYYVASSLVLGPENSITWRFGQQMSLLVVLQLVSLLAFGAYRGLWRYVGIDDLVTFTKGVVAGTVLGYAGMRATGMLGQSAAAVFAVDAMLLLIMIASSRITFRVLRWVLPEGAAQGKRALIYGAGDAGELLLRELMNNRSLGFEPVGFIDDDPLKVGRRIHGLRVVAGNGTVAEACKQAGAEVVLISSLKIESDRLREIRELCSRIDVALHRMHLRLEPVMTISQELRLEDARIPQADPASMNAPGHRRRSGEMRRKAGF